ncbi:MAG: translation initiation factor [Planctomycetota bacterium]
MARREPDPPRELDPSHGGLKHNPLAALRGKVNAVGPGPAPAPAAKPAPAPPQGRVSVRIERSGRGGKAVTIAEGPGLAGRQLEPLAREIARGMGAGARVEHAAIVVQGDQRARLVEWLVERGFGGAVAGN